MPTPEPRESPADDRFAGVRALRRHHQGTLQFHERVAQVKLVVEGLSGQIVMPVEPGFAISGEEMLLWLPAESDWDAQASVVIRSIDRPEAIEAVDRWRAYHGETSVSAWIRAEIDGLKTESGVYGDEVQRPNALGRAEYPLIRRANADRAKLIGACKLHAATLVPDAQCVGVDPFGIDVKARFGIVRLEFPPGIIAETTEACEKQIDRLLDVGGGGGGAGGGGHA
jgi:hypothetical protein